MHPHAPAARLFGAYSQTLGAEPPMLRFMHGGLRMDGALPLAEHGIEEGDEARTLGYSGHAGASDCCA